MTDLNITSVNKRTCTRCVMDNSVADIKFDELGVCNYCHDFDTHIRRYTHKESDSKENIEKMVMEIKKRGRNSKYDCVVGLSGGVDSSYVAYLSWKLGLRCLAVHFDNGWNSEISVANIKRIIEVTGFDLHTYVIDWPEFRGLQKAFLKASVVDIELVTDHAIFASMYKLTREKDIPTILSGTNYVTEHGMPDGWSWHKQDLTNINAINKLYGEKKLKRFPTISSFKWQLMVKLGIGPRFVEPLNLLNYKKLDAVAILKKEFSWREYGGKHCESVFTKFYQEYILPEKFKIDKRLVHLSALIRNGEITQKQALLELGKENNSKNIDETKAYVLKKLGLSESEFGDIMKSEPKLHSSYKSEKELMRKVLVAGAYIKNWGRRLKLVRR